ncbi:hypothetical protein FQN54_007932 [Arachnomyces sp. PD_36]|nr:hypothetical protein FQN54_007932 [Arachnomyces sp. PD_36]
MSNSPEEPNWAVRLPGLGRPLTDFPPSVVDKHGRRVRFPHAIADPCLGMALTVREKRMMEFINKITDKPEWERKVLDEAIVTKWREEACYWCMEELRDKAAHYESSRLVAVLDGQLAVVKSDVAVSPDLAGSLRKCATVLEDVPDHAKDWHPGSNGQVLDLLHPSLFPLEYGSSTALPSGTVPLVGCERFICAGETVDHNPPEQYPITGSWGKTRTLKVWGSFQWLPSDVHFAEDGSAVITSYINNLHPDTNGNLYGVLERFVTASVPLWNECLSWFGVFLRFGEIYGSRDDFKLPEGITYPGASNGVADDANDGYDSDDLDYRDWFDDHKVLIQVEPEPSKPRQARLSESKHGPVDLRDRFRDSGLQVIFKLANIHLTPEKPEYEGGSWHIEGALNEHICATSLYYYDEENITESYLGFRQALDIDKIFYEQFEFESVEMYYGIRNEETTIQTLGKVLTRQGRLLAFPNVLQHQVQPFKLADPSKPGHRKILAMFLVDPHIRIPSTANVPPQRKDWWASEVRKIRVFNALPWEIFDMIINFVHGQPMSWEDAIETRQELMNERGALEEKLNGVLEESTFFFCEH